MQVRTLLGERGARIAAEKQHCAQVEGTEVSALMIVLKIIFKSSLAEVS